MFLMIAVIDDGNNMRAFRLYNTGTEEIVDILESDVIEDLKTGRVLIENLGLDENNELVGTQGIIPRYARINRMSDTRDSYPIVILYRTPNGYVAIDWVGRLAKLTTDDVMSYADRVGLANAKINNKNGVRYVSAISGTFEMVGGKLSDDLLEQWNRLNALKDEGKLTRDSMKMLSVIEKDFAIKMKKLQMSESKSKLNGAFDLAKTYDLINDIAEILDEVDIERVDNIQRKVSRQYKEVKTCGRSIKDKERKEMFNSDIKKIGKELKRTIRYVDEEELSSDECIRRLEVISKCLDRLKSTVEN